MASAADAAPASRLVWPLLLARVDLEADMVLRMETQHEVVAGSLAEASRRMPDWQAAPSAATAAPLVSALTEHRAALLEHLHDEEEYILPLIEEHLTVAEWARLGQRFAEEVPKDKMLFFLGMILEDADPAERQAMMAHLPLRHGSCGRRSASDSSAVGSARSAPGSADPDPAVPAVPSLDPVQRSGPGVTRVGPAGPGSRASTAGAGRSSHGGAAPWPPQRRSRRAAT